MEQAEELAELPEVVLAREYHLPSMRKEASISTVSPLKSGRWRAGTQPVAVIGSQAGVAIRLGLLRSLYHQG